MLKHNIVTLILLYFMVTPCFADFRFAVIGDSRDNSADGINNRVMEMILDKIKSEGADFIMLTGDMITGSTIRSTYRNRLKKWKAIIERYGIPYYISVGNHEIKSEISEGLVREIFEMPANGPQRYKELVYSFDHKNSHFIVIDTNVYEKFHEISDEQLEWIRDDLAKNAKSIIFVFGHEPAYPVSNHIGSSLDKSPLKRDQLWGIFKEYKVCIYFCGHEHLYNRSIHDGVYQVITGGAGADLSRVQDKLSFHHYLLVDVKDDGSVDVSVKDMNGIAKDIFKIEN